MQVIRPSQLQPGDTIGIISPASPIAAFCPRRLQRGIDELRNMGFDVVVGPHARERTGHTAGTILQRVTDLHDMFANSEIKAIITTIGGYNSHQLLDELNYDLIAQNPKILMGYSDITALLAAIHRRTGLVTFMGPAILPQFGEFGGMLDYTKHSFRSVLMETKSIGEIQPSSEWTDETLHWDSEDGRVRQTKPNGGMKVLKLGVAKGPLLAGNAGTLLLLAGTSYFPDMEGRILCLEDDEGESPATIDRYLTHLRQMGVYQKITGLVIGRFHSKLPFSEEDSLEQLLLAATRGFDFPVVYDADFGHTDPMMVLPNGVEARLDAMDVFRPKFEIVTSAVI